MSAEPTTAAQAAERTARSTPAALELRRFLELGVAQLDAAVRESDARVQQLAAAVTAMATDARELEAHTADRAQQRVPAAIGYPVADRQVAHGKQRAGLRCGPGIQAHAASLRSLPSAPS